MTIDMMGTRIKGFVVVAKHAQTTASNQQHWLVRCESCGWEKVMAGLCIRRGSTATCPICFPRRDPKPKPKPQKLKPKVPQVDIRFDTDDILCEDPRLTRQRLVETQLRLAEQIGNAFTVHDCAQHLVSLWRAGEIDTDDLDAAGGQRLVDSIETAWAAMENTV